MAKYKIGDEVLVRGIVSSLPLKNGMVNVYFESLSDLALLVEVDGIESLAPPKPDPIKVDDWVDQTIYPYQKLLHVKAINDGQAWVRDLKGIYSTIAVASLRKANRNKPTSWL